MKSEEVMSKARPMQGLKARPEGKRQGHANDKARNDDGGQKSDKACKKHEVRC